MAQHPFYRLAPFIQEYIYGNSWEELRPVQVRAIEGVLDSDHHLLIASATASGKTEAALLPILTQLNADPSDSIGVLYIGPLKALINDQFERLQALLEETETPVQSWHGDVAQSKKARFLDRAEGILQITPESLEAMLINRHAEMPRLFGDLRFVVIDEVHALISSDHGRQVICQMQRLARYQRRAARRIGLSATLGEPGQAASWLAGGTDTPVTLIDDSQSRRSVQLGLDHFLIQAEIDDEPAQPKADDPLNSRSEGTNAVDDEDPTSLAALLADERSVYAHIYGMCQGAVKTLIFANQRAEVEETAANLRMIAGEQGTPDIYHVHHGSIAAPLREAAEAAMRDTERPACTVATVTLELGIDIGQLDQVLQINTTHSVSSFVQRLGRSGRRGDPARLFFYHKEEAPPSNATLGQLMPWDLLQTIAIVQLYVEERWIEPPQMPRLPLSLLYHQTMSTLMAATELMPSQLAQHVLTLSPFANITQEQYRDLLRHLIEIQQIEQMETGSLIIGLEGEKVVNNYRFYATFEDERTVRVVAVNREIGAINAIPEVDSSIRLAGHTWRVVRVEPEQKIVHVQQAKGRATSMWSGGGAEIHTRVLERLRQVLQEDVVYPYFHPRAAQRLAQARSLAKHTGMAYSSILPQSQDRYMLLPWCGTQTFRSLALILKQNGIKIERMNSPFYLEVSQANDRNEGFQTTLQRLVTSTPDPHTTAAVIPELELQRNKYDRFVPTNLLRQAFLQDALDIYGAAAALKRLVQPR